MRYLAIRDTFHLEVSSPMLTDSNFFNKHIFDVLLSSVNSSDFECRLTLLLLRLIYCYDCIWVSEAATLGGLRGKTLIRRLICAAPKILRNFDRPLNSQTALELVRMISNIRMQSLVGDLSRSFKHSTVGYIRQRQLHTTL